MHCPHKCLFATRRRFVLSVLAPSLCYLHSDSVRVRELAQSRMADDLQSSEELAFVAEEVDRIIMASIESCLKDEVYDEQRVAQWVDFICESIMRGLAELRKPLKYVVSCAIMQKNGAGVHSAISCYWDTVTDGAHVVKWPGDKHKDHNRSMYCITTVGGLSF